MDTKHVQRVPNLDNFGKYEQFTTGFRFLTSNWKQNKFTEKESMKMYIDLKYERLIILISDFL